MNYMLLIHQGDSPTPPSPEAWATLSEEEQKVVYADYQAVNQTPGVTSGHGLDAPETANHRAGAGGQDAHHRRPFRRDQGGHRRLPPLQADELNAAIELASRIPAARLGGAVEARPIVEW